MIELRHVEKAYADSTPLKDVSAVIRQGDVIAVIGPSGCGKSTLLRCINMLDPPTGGQILVNGEDITAHGRDLNRLRKKIGMIFQSYHLFQHQPVIENIMRPQMRLLGRSKQEAYDKAYSLLALMGLTRQQFRFPDQLSGGQQQRVAIARALAMDPEILLLDEPTSALDPTMVGEVETVLYDLAKRGTTMLLVTHDMNLARRISSRVFYMDEGGIYEDGPPEQIFLNPRREKTRRFIRGMRALSLSVEGAAFDYPGAVAEISRFGSLQGLDAKTVYRMQMVFEELCAIYLPGRAGGAFRASAEFEADAQEHTVTLTVCHNAGAVPETALREDLSLLMVRRMTASLEQTVSPEPGDALPFRITMTMETGEVAQNAN